MNDEKNEVTITITVKKYTYDALMRISSATKDTLGQIIDSFFPKPH